MSAKFDLLLLATDSPLGLRLGLEYNTDLFDGETMERMLEHYQTLLQAVVDDPKEKIARLPMLTPREQAQLATWNDTETEYPREQCIHALIEEQAARTPNARAVEYAGQHLTYAQLNARANQLARALRAQGVGPDMPVGVFLERSLEMVVGLLGILKAGAAYVPIDADYPQDRIAHLLADSRASVALTQRRLQAQLPETAARTIFLDASPEMDSLPDTNLSLPYDSGNAAYIIYTSGSTGLPKGVVVTHRNLVHSTRARRSVYPYPPTKFLLLSSFAFDSSVAGIFWTLCEGGCLLLPARPVQEDLAGALDLIVSAGISHYLCVPSLHSVFLEELGSRQAETLSTVIVAGEECTSRLVANHFARLPQTALFNEYGPTEATVWASVWQADSHAIPATVPIGRPIPNSRLYVLDARLQPTPVGIAGELYIGGEGLACGYWNHPGLTAEKFVPHPFSLKPGARLYRTGDLVRYLPDGNLEYLGRLDHQVKIRGFRIELGEIENVLLAHPAVKEALVVACEEGSGDRRLVAYVVGESEAVSVSALHRHLREKLPEYMTPSAFVFLKALPLTPNGKVDRKALPSPETNEQEEMPVTPRNPIEEGVGEIWREVLHLEQVSIYADFFEQGGHSLLATQVISRIRNTFQVELPVRALFEAPTIAELAERVLAARGQTSLSAPPLVGASQDGPLPLSFAQQRLWFVHKLDPRNPAYNVPGLLRIRGALSTPALHNALEMLVRRHAILRTTYVETEGVPAQVVSPDLEIPLHEVDLSGVEAEKREEEAVRLAVEESQVPFDLRRAPLVRSTLYSLNPTDHLLSLTMHHIASDAWSLALIVREIAALYDAALEGRSDALAELPIQYADYALWQREWMESEAMQEQLDYWRRQLEGAPQTSNLPFDRPRPRVPSLRGAALNSLLSPENTGKLHAMSRQEGATLFMTLLACFKAMLYCMLDAEDVVVGTDIAGRNRAELERLVGFFINHLVLRTDLSGNPSFRELVARVRGASLDAYSHQDVPFDRLVDMLQPERDNAASQLFQILFVMQNVMAPAAQANTISIRLMGVETCTSKFDLAIFFHEGDLGSGRQIHGEWVYSTDLFDKATIRQMAERFETVVSQVVVNPEIRLADLKKALYAADQARRRAEQEQRDAANYSRFQRIKPQSQSVPKSPVEESR